MPEPTLLRLVGVSRVFGGIRALDALDLSVPGGIVGLIGPNGAGKTTVLNLISGLLRPSAGAILLDEQSIEARRADEIAARGVARTYQNIRLFRGLSVLENVLVGAHARRTETLFGRLAFLPAARRAERTALDRARMLLADVGLADRAGVPAGALPYGDQRRLEIARALAAEPRLLLLDEPAAGMPFGEVEQLMALVRSLPDRGVAVLLVEHNMQLVMSVCERIAVLDFGRKIADAAPAEIRADPAVIEAYLGVTDGAGA